MDGGPDEPGFDVFVIVKGFFASEQLEENTLETILSVLRLPTAQKQHTGHGVSVLFKAVKEECVIQWMYLLSVV